MLAKAATSDGPLITVQPSPAEEQEMVRLLLSNGARADANAVNLGTGDCCSEVAHMLAHAAAQQEVQAMPSLRLLILLSGARHLII